MSSEQDKLMAQYLLGQLPKEEQAQLEYKYFADDALFEELVAIEGELRDAYERGELSAADRKAFEQRLLATEDQGREQAFASTLNQYLGKMNKQLGPMARLAAKCKSLVRVIAGQPRMALVSALSTIMILVVAVWWFARRSVPPPQLRPAENTSSTAMSAKQEQELGAKTITVVLRRGLSRGTGEESKPVVLPPDVVQARLEAQVEVDFPSYEAILETPEGKRIWSQAALKAQISTGGRKVVVYVSRDLLSPGDYILTLRGLPASGTPETVAEYSFSVSFR